MQTTFLFKTFSLLLLLNLTLLAGPARGGVITFTQPDGTTFQGLLKGTSAFHWIESDGQIIKYKEKDKFYHIAKFDANSSLIITSDLPRSVRRAPSLNGKTQMHSVDIADKKKLKAFYKKKQTEFAPQ